MKARLEAKNQKIENLSRRFKDRLAEASTRRSKDQSRLTREVQQHRRSAPTLQQITKTLSGRTRLVWQQAQPSRKDNQAIQSERKVSLNTRLTSYTRPNSLQPIKGAETRQSSIKSALSCLDDNNFCLEERALSSRNSFNLAASVNRLSFKSQKKTNEHNWDELTQKKKQYRIKYLKPIEPKSRLLCKKSESPSKLKSTSNAKSNGKETINAIDEASQSVHPKKKHNLINAPQSSTKKPNRMREALKGKL